MKIKLFTIRDQKLNQYQKPFGAPTVEAVAREIKSAVERGEGDVGRYPEDHDIYQIGEFDHDTGVLIPLKAPLHITSCLAFKPLTVAKPQQVRDDISL